MRLQIDAERQTILLAALDAYTQVLGASKKAREKATLNTDDEDDRLHIINGQPDGLKWQLGYREEKPEKPKDPAQQDAFGEEAGAETGGRGKVGADLHLREGSMITWPSGDRTRVVELVEYAGEPADPETAWRVRDENGSDVWVAMLDGVWAVQPQALIEGDDIDNDYSAGSNPRTAQELMQALGIDVPLDVVEMWDRQTRAQVEAWCVGERKERLHRETEEMTDEGRAHLPPVLAAIVGEGDDTDDTRTLGMDDGLRSEQGELGASDDELTPSAETLADLEG